MGENTKIEWAHHTFNPWHGCTKVSAACDHCYAEAWAKRAGRPDLWEGERRLASEKAWRDPLKWNANASAQGVRYRVFCASLADVFDNQVPEEWRWRLWDLIFATVNLDWLLLTKRPQNIAKMLPTTTRWPWPNVWLGTTVENQEEAERRIPHLLNVPARVHFLSCEPLLESLDLSRWTTDIARYREYCDAVGGPEPKFGGLIDWVIVGGESGNHSRPMHPAWARRVRDDCKAAGVAFHFKQWGEWYRYQPVAGGDLGGLMRAGKVDIAHVAKHTDAELCTRSFFPGDVYVERIGKKRAGRLLDGVEHNGLPRAV